MKTTQPPFERALSRAEKDGVRVVMDFGDHWRVRGSDGVTLYEVCQDASGMRCTCQSRHYCQHQAVCQQRLNERQAERERIAAEVSVALTLTECSERSLAGPTSSQKERLRALAYLPVAMAAYAVVLGPAHAWQWHQAKEEQWERYQACRMSHCWY